MDYERIKNTELSQLYVSVLFCKRYLMPFFPEAFRQHTFKKLPLGWRGRVN